MIALPVPAATAAPWPSWEADAEPPPGLDGLLIGSLAWQEQEWRRADAKGWDWDVEGAIRRAYADLEPMRDALWRINCALDSVTGKQLDAGLTNVLDLDFGLSVLPAAQANLWRMAVVGQRRVQQGAAVRWEPAAPLPLPVAARELGLAVRQAVDLEGRALAFLTAFLCHEGVFDPRAAGY